MRMIATETAFYERIEGLEKLNVLRNGSGSYFGTSGQICQAGSPVRYSFDMPVS
jgi:hypothetical protein